MSLRVGIVGGSVGGLFAGVLLHRAGHDVSVLEQARRGLSQRGAGLVVQDPVRRLLARVGLSSLADVGVWARERVTLAGDGSILQRDPRSQMQMPWDLLYDGFRRLLPVARYHVGAHVDRVATTATSAQATLSGGATHEFDLVIGADGQGSVVRDYVEGDGRVIRPNYAGYAVWRGLIPETAIPAWAAAQLLERMVFHSDHRGHAVGYLITGAGGQTAPGQRRYNWGWYRPMAADALRTLLASTSRVNALALGPREVPQAMRDDLARAAREQLPPALAAAVLAEPRPYVQPIYDYAGTRMVRQRLVLLGDAAFIARPHTAFGVAKAAADALALADAMAAQPLDAALAAYEAVRLPQGRALVDYGRRLGDGLGVRGE